MLPQSEGGGTGLAFPVILKSQNREGKLQLVAECTERAYFDADAAGAAALLLGLPRCGSGRRSLLGPPRRAASPASPRCSFSFLPSGFPPPPARASTVFLPAPHTSWKSLLLGTECLTTCRLWGARP